MKMELKTFCDVRAISVIKDFVISAAGYFGASSKECKDLELASEEAAEHIISNHPVGSSEFFEVSCEGINGILKVIFSNKGVPVNENNIPVYMADNPADSLDGLQFFIIRKLTDNFYFHNCGSDGWQTIIEKKIANFTGVEVHQDESDIDLSVHSKEKLTVDLAAPEDAYEITKLAYFTYRYTYAKTIFYYPEMLKEAIENRSVISFVVKNSSGEIVGHSAYMRSPYCREIAEAGGMMSMPEYRKTLGMMRLVKKQHNYPYEEHFDVTIVESNLITAHTGSQRITRTFKFAPMALKISVHDRAEFLDIDEVVGPRETLLYSIWVPHEMKATTIFIPEVHFDIVDMLIKNADIPLEIKRSTLPAVAEKGTFNIETKPEYGLATVMVEEIGVKWRKNLKSLSRDLSSEGFQTIHLKIPIWDPLPADVDSELKAAGFFFSGIIPRTPSKWLMIYTYLSGQKMDFSGINVCDETAVKLKDYIEQCYDDE